MLINVLRSHCLGGPGPFNFGAAIQIDASFTGIGQSSTFGASHDAVLALIDWVENGVAPDVLIGSKYIDDDLNKGVQLQRKLCP